MQRFGNFRGIKLTSHTMKIWERADEAMLRGDVTISEQRHGFMLRKSCTDVMCALKVVMKEYREGGSVDQEKPYDWVLRDKMWKCIRKEINQNVFFLIVPSGNQWVPDSTKLPWSDGETEALLDIWGSEEIQENLKGSAKNKQIFLQISQVMTSQGYLRTPEQCQSRIKRLRANFRHFLEGRK